MMNVKKLKKKSLCDFQNIKTCVYSYLQSY